MPQPSSEFLHASAQDRAHCRAMIRTGSKSFFAASLVLPQPVREPAYALYAFCRMADDTVDLGGGRHGAVERLRERLDRIYANRPAPSAVDRALTDVVHRFALPRQLLDALIEGLAWDADGRRYETLAELRAYAARVAATVGAMMTLLMGVREPAVIARACDLGVAMQLTNIARDVGEDARAGRIYLPLVWLREAGVEPDHWLGDPQFDDRIAAVVQRLLDEADLLYEQATSGIADLPLACRPGIHAARLLYAEIGRELERQGRDSITRRAVVSGRRKAWLMTQAVVDAVLTGGHEPFPSLDEVQFLVRAVADGQPPPSGANGPWQSFDRRLVGVIDLLTRLEERKRSERAMARV
ncbi:MAG: phytoene/squalene synthase family protein [Pseudomonadota bacterium]